MRALALALLVPVIAQADPLRVATFDAAITRKGPGLALADLRRGDDPQIEAALAVIAEVKPDVLLLTGGDYDSGEVLLSEIRARLVAMGVPFGYQRAAMPNSGMPTGLDLDGNGRLGEARDSQGFGWFNGMQGMALLSTVPITDFRDFSAMLWADLPVGRAREAGLSDAALAVQRLSSTGHWDVTVAGPDGPVHLLAYSATPPAFDEGTGRNILRNHDETAFWLAYLSGVLPQRYSGEPFVILGKASIDPVDGAGDRGAFAILLGDERLQDPKPKSAGGAAQPRAGQKGDPALDTAVYAAPIGNLRADYVLPSRDFRVLESGVYWPKQSETVEAASNHRLVWVDIEPR